MSWKSVFTQMSLFQKTALLAAAVTFLLIFIGGLVRATGAGLGCPDWPRCFGLWIPPVDVSGLPAEYDPAEFNVFKTWMEYVNRLFGVLVGFLILLTFLFSLRYVRKHSALFYGAFAALVLVLFQGWLGGQVVRSGLEGWKISVHMIVAVLIFNVLLWIVYESLKDRFIFSVDASLRARLLKLLPVLLMVILLQMISGTQVREALEMVASQFPGTERTNWIDKVGWIDPMHRTFSWLVLGLVVIFHRLACKMNSGPYLPSLAWLTTITVLLQIGIGVVLVYLGLPPAFQVLHLWLAVVLFSAPFLALLLVRQARSV